MSRAAIFGPFAVLAAIAAATGTIATPALAAPDRDFPLGQSATGVVCEAVQEYEDDAVQVRGARAWSIHCRGYTAIFGHIYSFERDAPSMIGAGSVWRKELAERANCGEGQAVPIAGISGATRTPCKSIPGGVTYQVYTQVDGDSAAIAEGFAPLSDLVEAGLKIVIGAEPIPESALQAQPGGEYSLRQGEDTGGGESLASAANAAQQTSDWLKNRAHVENQGWLFEDAERDFRSLAASNDVSEKDRAYDMINVALNVSNQGRFAEADQLFAEADTAVNKVRDPELGALALNYRSLHFLNQRKFADALATAQKAVAARNTIDPGVDAQASAIAVGYEDNGNALVISPVLAEKLNEREHSTGFRVVRLTSTERLQIQNAQAEFVIGVSRAELGDGADGRQVLEDVVNQLSNPRWIHSAAFLRAETLGALARLDLKQNKPGDAEERFKAAIKVFTDEKDLQGSPAQATLYLGLAQSEAATDQTDNALLDYQTGFEVFQEARRSLGDTRNAAGPYFDLLIQKMQKEPANARAYQNEFFNVAQIIVGEATAGTLARLSARVSKGDDRSVTLARQLDDTQRQIAIRIAESKRQQDTGANATADQAELAALTREAETLQQQLLDANPHYGQVVEETATLDKMQAALGQGEIYVKTVLLADRGYAIAISHDSVEAYAIPLTRADAIAKVKTLRMPFDADVVTRFDVPLSHELFVAIFGPVQDQVKAARLLIYEPDSAMVNLPASVFVADSASVDKYDAAKAQDPNGRLDLNLYDGTAWLGRATDVSLTVSATAFLQSRSIKPSRGTQPFLAFGDPVTQGNDPRRYALLVDKSNPATVPACERLREEWATKGPGALAGIADTIHAVGRAFDAPAGDLVLGQSFTDGAVKSRTDLANYRVVFFGTHAVLPASYPCLPEAVLVTSLGPSPSDGFLDEGEILGLKMDADMVVLAACDTGGEGANEVDRTGLSGSGDELSGLARDFIYAGARNIVVSQWKVDAAATSTLMSHVFQSAAADQSDALRQAEVTLMNEKGTAHPYYWAGFSLVGDGARAMPARAARTAQN
jgi:CHAT domain-containing protein